MIPFEFQKDTVREIEEFNGRALVSLEMGLGKTLCTLLFFKRQKIPSFPALVVCPANVKAVWRRESEAVLGFRPEILDGQRPPRNTTRLLDPPKLTVVNYDILMHWIPYLEDQRYTTIVFDECHYLGNRSTDRTKGAMHIARGCRNALGLDGTPLVNKPAELWPILNIIRPDLFPDFFSFVVNYCDPRRRPWGWDFSGAKNLDKLHKLLKRHLMIRRLKKDVLKDLPNSRRSVIPVDLRDPAEYIEARDFYKAWLLKNYRVGMASALRAEALTHASHLLRIVAKQKMKAVVDWANRFLTETDEKLILFGYHKKCIDVLARRVEARHTIVNGEVTGAKREMAIRQFQEDAKTRLILCNILAGGVGTTLTAASTTGVAELWWRPGDLLQLEARAHRIGQTKQCWTHYFIAYDTIEEKMCKALHRKQVAISQTLDGERVDDELNLMDTVIADVLGPQAYTELTGKVVEDT